MRIVIGVDKKGEVEEKDTIHHLLESYYFLRIHLSYFTFIIISKLKPP